mmetsp:Transcript_71693/g.202714  ORF Transcript_71693/g.202714 Transcript_71693/m.202714 type:complete len:178 (+) Transcript_71693:69-602(+)
MAAAAVEMPTAMDVDATTPMEKTDKQAEEDLYVKYKTLQKQLEFFDIQEEYIKDEMKNLKRELIRAKDEIKRIQSVPLVIGQFSEMVDGACPGPTCPSLIALSTATAAATTTNSTAPTTSQRIMASSCPLRARTTSCASSRPSTARSSSQTRRSRCTATRTALWTSSHPRLTQPSSW